MGVYSQTMGFRRPLNERRSGKDRRKHVDPRYRNPSFLQFVDRRMGDRRKPVYEEVHPFVKEHPLERWIIIIGILVVAFLMYVFFFTNLIATKRGAEERHRKGTIVLGYDLVNDINGMGQKKLDSDLSVG